MKSLKESLFDIEKNMSTYTGYEYLYGLVESASIFSDYKIDYFNKDKIRREFNKLSKKFPPRDWMDGTIDSMKKFQPNEQNEILRELLYIITDTIKTTDIKFTNDRVGVDADHLSLLVFDVIEKYLIGSAAKEFATVWVGNGRSDSDLIKIFIEFYIKSPYKNRVAEFERAGVIRIFFDKKIFK